MQKKIQKFLMVLGASLLAGCTAGTVVPQAGNLAVGNATLQVQPQIFAGGITTQTVVNNYASADVNHLQVKLFKLNGSSENAVNDASGSQLVKDVLNASLNAPIVFTNLNANATYRIRAYAYNTSGTGALISTSDVTSYTDVTLTTEDRPTLTNLKVKLIDKVFNGQATASGVVVTNGGLVASGSEAIN